MHIFDKDSERPSYETRVYLRNQCLLRPNTEQEFAFAGLAAIFLPILIEKVIGTAATALKKAGDSETLKDAGRLPTYLYQLAKAQNGNDLKLNPEFGCVIVVRGTFDKHKQPPPDEQSETVKLLRAGKIPVRELAFVYEAQIDIADDKTALRYESRYLELNGFIGRERKTESDDRRGLVLSLAISGVGDKEGEPVLSLAMINFGELHGKTILESDDLVTKQSSWLGGLAISDASLKAIQNMKPSDKPLNVMPITIDAMLAETRDGNAALKFIGEVLDTAKADVAKKVSGDILGGEKKAAEAVTALEKLLGEEETAFTTLLDAELEFAKQPASSNPPTETELKTRAVKRFAIESAGRAWCAKFQTLQNLGKAPSRPGHTCPVTLPN